MKVDTRTLAKEIEKRVKERVSLLGSTPKIVSILVGDDRASELYTRLKSEAARRVGIEFEVVRTGVEDLALTIKKVGERDDVTGVMVQLPIPGLSREEQGEIIKAIPVAKDVDGLRWEESGVMPATVRAIMQILDMLQIENERGFVVVGDRGSVGKPLMHYLSRRGVKKLVGVNSETEDLHEKVLQAEVVISCVGKEGVVTGEMVQGGIVAVDVGAPRGDMTQEVYDKASRSVEVPGGVGPVTVSSLMESLLEICNI